MGKSRGMAGMGRVVGGRGSGAKGGGDELGSGVRIIGGDDRRKWSWEAGFRREAAVNRGADGGGKGLAAARRNGGLRS